MSDASGVFSSVWPSARRLAVGGVACALVVLAAGVALEQVRLGRSNADAFVRVEREVRARVEGIGVSVRAVSRTLASRAAQVQASETDEESTRQLFDAVDAAVRPAADPDLAATIYDVRGTPLAWSGRPLELPAGRLTGSAAQFVIPGPLGLWLVDLEEVVDAASAGGRRLGTVATEHLLSVRRGVGSLVADTFTFETAIAPVSLRLPSAGSVERTDPFVFVIKTPTGDNLLEARVSEEALTQSRQQWRAGVRAACVGVLAATLLLITGPLLTVRARARSRAVYAAAIVGLSAAVVIARVALGAVTPPAPIVPEFGSAPGAAERLARLILRSPLDFLLTGLLALVLVALANQTVERWRLAVRRLRRPVRPVIRRFFWLVPLHLAAGTVVVLLIVGYQALLRVTVTYLRFDVLDFSLRPWDTERLVLQGGLILSHAAAVWSAAFVLRLALVRCRFRRTDPVVIATLSALWSAPLFALGVSGWAAARAFPWWSPILVLGVAASIALLARGFVPRYRHASQAARLVYLFLALVLPGLTMYPTLVHYADRSAQRTIEAELAGQVLNQQEDLQVRLRRSLDQINRISTLPDLVAAAPPPSPTGAPPTDAAFQVWVQTELALYRLASAVEIYGPDGSMVSRFALNLPEYMLSQQKWSEDSCAWELFGEVSPIGSVERVLLHAGRNICVGDPARPAIGGTIVVHVLPDYDTLPFISSRDPYSELFRTPDGPRRSGLRGRDVVFAVYGWGRSSTYASGVTPWPLEEDLFARIYASRTPFWAVVTSAGQQYQVFFQNDRFGIYALGYSVLSLTGHLVNLTELITLTGVIYVLGLTLAVLGAWVSGREAATGRALFREIRVSFYRKLLLAFIASALVPVLTLAVVTRAYVAARLQAESGAAAVRTTAVAQRVIEEYGTLQDDGARAAAFDDDVMVWISGVIGQDVNIFSGPYLTATSKRDLFESGLLPTRTPADVYRGIVLRRLASVLTEERVAEFSYGLAAAPIRAGEQQVILTVPLTLRQQETRRELDTLTRRLSLATLVFILVGAALGYTMAERIADPVNRLTRATRRIARGDLEARIAATSSDELRRLVEAFNSMADDLRRQRSALERTNRLEAWAEMARQVAHEIKNPLTPIQLSAEHLRRVHTDRGRPLDPVLDECIESILSQVRLLRQIAAEFSSFASSPTPRPESTSVVDLIEEVVQPYRAGTAHRISLVVDVAPDLPLVSADRTLLGRALTNVIENALHAMPGRGELTLQGALDRPARRIRLSVTDTGAGMDEEARRRVFEPYFSTKAAGTGLGLTIAKRNIELHGGDIAVDSTPGEGTRVVITLPVL